MAKDVWFPIPSLQQYKTAAVLSVYEGRYSLITGRWDPQSTNGGAFLKFAKYQNGKDTFEDKARPVKVDLGTKDEAVYILRTMADVLEGEAKPPPQPVPYQKPSSAPAASSPAKFSNDDIPF